MADGAALHPCLLRGSRFPRVHVLGEASGRLAGEDTDLGLQCPFTYSLSCTFLVSYWEGLQGLQDVVKRNVDISMDLCVDDVLSYASAALR